MIGPVGLGVVMGLVRRCLTSVLLLLLLLLIMISGVVWRGGVGARVRRAVHMVHIHVWR